MPQPNNTFDSYDAVGNREDLEDFIYNISPEETPFLSQIAKRGSASAVVHEWQTDALAAAAANAVIEGDDATLDAVTPTVRLNNRSQISDKTVVITGTQESVDKAGRKKELAYQLAKKTKELKRDMEFILTQNQALAVGDSSTARTLAGVETWLHTNVSRGSMGADASFTSEQPDATSQPTDGTQRALTETLLKGVIKDIWTQGGDPSIIMVGPFQKQAISGFTGSNAYRREESARSKRMTAAIDVYESDFGVHRVVANRFSRDRTTLVLTPELWKVCYLRPLKQHPLAKTGDSEKRQLLVEYTLAALNEKGSGAVADCTTS